MLLAWTMKRIEMESDFLQRYPQGLPLERPRLSCSARGCQVAMPMFFIKTLPMMDDGDDVAMVLSPQLFNNTDVHADIFNHSNIHFWEYMQIGALQFVCLWTCSWESRWKAHLRIVTNVTDADRGDIAQGIWTLNRMAEFTLYTFESMRSIFDAFVSAQLGDMSVLGPSWAPSPLYRMRCAM